MEPSELDHAEAYCLCDRIGAADGLELVEKRSNMKLNRVDRYSEATRDGFVRCTLGQEAQDLYFARRKGGVLFNGFLASVRGDECNVTAFVHPRQSQSRDVGK